MTHSGLRQASVRYFTGLADTTVAAVCPDNNCVLHYKPEEKPGDSLFPCYYDVSDVRLLLSLFQFSKPYISHCGPLTQYISIDKISVIVTMRNILS